MREAIRITIDLIRRPAFSPIVKELPADVVEAAKSDFALDRWMVRSPTPSGHLMGTCKMAPEFMPGTVGDEHCRVHGRSGRVHDRRARLRLHAKEFQQMAPAGWIWSGGANSCAAQRCSRGAMACGRGSMYGKRIPKR